MMIVRSGARLGAIGLLLACSAAIAETKIGAELGANAGYSSRPFGAVVAGGGGSTGSGTVSGTFMPTVSFLSPTGEIVLGGRVTHTEYLRRYSATTDYSTSARVSKRLSEVTSISGTAAFNSSVRNALYPVLDPTVPENPDGPIVVDPAGGENFARRTKTLTGSLAFNTSLSARDSLSVGVRGSMFRFTRQQAFASDYDSYGANFAYRRAIGDNSSIGVSMDVGKMTYAEAAFGDSMQYSPAALLQVQLASRITLDLSAGVTISEFNRLGGSMNQTTFSGSGNLCRQGDQSTFCLQASRRVSPSTISGASNVLSAGASYSYAFNERSSIRASASYARARSLGNVAGPLPGLNGRNYDFAYGSVAFDHRILERLSAVVSLSYSDSFNQIGTARGSNVSGTVGIRYRLGEL